MIFLGYSASLAYGFLCLLIAVVAYNFGIPKQYTRKIVHILVGFEWAILYHTVGVGMHFVAVCLIFTAMLAFSYRKKLFTMMSSDSDNAPGTVYYGVAMSVMAVLSIIFEGFVLAFGVAVFCTSLGDGLAGVLGARIKRFNFKIYKNKTLVGTLSAFVFSLISILVFSLIYELKITPVEALCISAFAAGLELISGFGLDNITLPLGTATLTYLLMQGELINGYVIPIVLTPFIVAFASSAKILTKKGILMALALDFAVSVSLGNFGFIMLLAFLLLSVLIDKIKKSFRRENDEVTKKTGARDSMQVVANGIAPAVFAILYLFTQEFVFIIAYIAALAECFADTTASGFGMLSKNAFDPFKMKKVQVGLSGGMSLIGTAASFVSAVAFSMLPVVFDVIDLMLSLKVAMAAFLGVILDSMLGSLLQSKYKCKQCFAITEKEVHCGTETELIFGFKCINNDVVNVVSCVFSSALSILAFLLI